LDIVRVNIETGEGFCRIWEFWESQNYTREDHAYPEAGRHEHGPSPTDEISKSLTVPTNWVTSVIKKYYPDTKIKKASGI